MKQPNTDKRAADAPERTVGVSSILCLAGQKLRQWSFSFRPRSFKLRPANRRRKVKGATAILVAGLALIIASVAFPQKPGPGSYKVDASQISTCLQCHGGVGFVAQDQTGRVRSFYVDGKALTTSVHKGLTCQDCHAGIDQVPHDKSKIVTPTCGMCHTEEADMYATSAHQPKNAVDVEHPTCLYCHGGNAHSVVSPKNYTTQQKLSICVGCHSNTALMTKWKVDPDAVQSYKDSFHGKAVRYGSQKAATCVDCHTAHHVLPKTNPLSSVNPAHSSETCSKCHQGAVAKFATAGVTHLAIKEKESPILRGEIGMFTVLTYSVLGLLCLGIILDVRAGVKHQFRRFRTNLKEEIMRGDQPEEKEAKVYLWFTPFQRMQHWMFATSFIVLALTGLPLRFYENEHMAALYSALGGLQLARSIHRGAALLMIIASLMHFGYLIWSWKKINFSIRKIVMLPTRQDIRDHTETWKFYLGKRETVPTFGRFSFRAKFGYWAVFWGLPIMVFSGLCLWFPVQAARVLPSLGVSVAYLAHADEAILAVGAIFIWHIYTTVFSPLYLPLGRKMIFGTVTQEEVDFEHGRHTVGEQKQP